MTNLHTQAHDEADRLRAAGDDGAADLAALRKEHERLRAALGHIRDFIKNCHLYDDDVGHPRRSFGEDDVRDLQRLARAALTPHGAVADD